MPQKYYGRLQNYLLSELSKKNYLLFVLIDPLDYTSIDNAIETAVVSAETGADVILVGGSIGVQGELLDNIIKSIKSTVKKPVILFPGNISTVSSYADGIYFMSLVNSHSPYWITGAQMQAANYIKSIGIEPLSVSYCVVEPGGTVGFIGQTNLVPRSKPQIAAAYGLMSEFFGFRFFLTDSGSNAPSPVPSEFVRTVSKQLSIPYIVGGGIKTPEQAKEMIANGADILQIGTAVERDSKMSVEQKISSFINSMEKGSRDKEPKNYKK